MFDFDKHLAELAEQTVLCVGDLMLDEFVYGEVTRISPEAPTPVIAVKRSELMVGGAGNVARNLVALGARCIFVGVVGDDDAGGALNEALGKHPLIECASGGRCRRARPRARCASCPSITRRICCAPIGKRRRRSMRKAKTR